MIDLDLLQRTTASWGITLHQTQLEQFADYAEALQQWNARYNLTAIVDPHDIVVRHFLDSLACALSWGEQPKRVVDIGSGAGFPGIPLKILAPDIQLTLVESIEKKASFLNYVVERLSLDQVQVVVARAEAIGHQPEHRAAYDVVLARAVAELRVLVEYCLPLCRIGGRFLAPKGGMLDAELAQAEAAISTVGGTLIGLETIVLPGLPPRHIAVIEKIAETPERYPRSTGIPTKRPL